MQSGISVVFYGRSGSGKGTQTDLLEKFLSRETEQKVVRIETGKGIRELIAEKGHTGEMLKNLYDHGGLMPAFLPIWVWGGSLIREARADNHLIFDGVCRRVEESPILHTALQFYQRTPFHVCLIDVSPAEATRRLLARGRSDDKQEEIQNRLNWFEADVVPAIEYFKKQSDVRYHAINGEQTPEAVFQDIIKGLL